MKSLKRSHFIFENILTTEEVLAFDRECDDYFALQPNLTETLVKDSRESAYEGIDPRALLTSYVDYFKILSCLSKHETLVDIGAGYCRGSLLSCELNLAPCLSIEFVQLRAQRALDLLGQKVIFIQNLENHPLPKADSYYLYFPRGKVLDQILKQIITFQADIFVCESHGDVMDYLDGLGFVKRSSFRAALPRHHSHIVRYSAPEQKVGLSWNDQLPLWMLYHQEDIFVVDYTCMGEQVEWLIPVKSAQWFIYHSKPALRLDSGRIVLISGRERIKSVVKKRGCYRVASDGKWLRKQLI